MPMRLSEVTNDEDWKRMYAERGEKIREAILRKRTIGEVAGKLSVGMKAASVNGKNVVVEDAAIQVSLREARILKRMGHSVREVRRFLAESGITQKSGKPLSVSTVHSLLRDKNR